MTTTSGGQWRQRLLRVLSLERGMLLWMPAVLGAAVFLLWAMRLVPSEQARYTESRQFRVILGAVDSPADEERSGQALRDALRRGLERQRDVALVPDADVRQRTAQLLASGAAADPRQCIRATRTLKARFYLTGEVHRMPQGDFTARIAVWETARERAVEELRLHGSTPRVLGRRLADSLAVTLFEPSMQRNALR